MERRMGPERFFDGVAAVGDDASEFIEVARNVAIAQFGEDRVAEIPRLVTDVAIIMATLASRHDGPMKTED